MTYQEMQQAEAELQAALSPQKTQRGATKAQLAYRAQRFGGASAEIAAYDADAYKAKRDVRAARRMFQTRLGGFR